DALELGVGGHRAQLAQDGVLRTRLNDSALMRRDRAKRTAAEAAAHDRDRALDHFERRDWRGVTWVWPAHVRGGVKAIHVRFGERQRRRRDDDGLAVVILDQRLGVEWVRVDVDDAGGDNELRLVGFDFFERGKEAKAVGKRFAKFGRGR